MIEWRTAEQIKQILQTEIGAHVDCAGTRIAIDVRRVEHPDHSTGEWLADVTAVGEPMDRDACQMAVLAIFGRARYLYRLVLDS